MKDTATPYKLNRSWVSCLAWWSNTRFFVGASNSRCWRTGYFTVSWPHASREIQLVMHGGWKHPRLNTDKSTANAIFVKYAAHSSQRDWVLILSTLEHHKLIVSPLPDHVKAPVMTKAYGTWHPDLDFSLTVTNCRYILTGPWSSRALDTPFLVVRERPLALWLRFVQVIFNEIQIELNSTPSLAGDHKTLRATQTYFVDAEEKREAETYAGQEASDRQLLHILPRASRITIRQRNNHWGRSSLPTRAAI